VALFAWWAVIISAVLRPAAAATWAGAGEGMGGGGAGGVVKDAFDPNSRWRISLQKIMN